MLLNYYFWQFVCWTCALCSLSLTFSPVVYFSLSRFLIILYCSLRMLPKFSDYVSTVFCQLGRLFQMLESLGTQIEKDVLLDKYRRPVNNVVCTKQWSSLTKKFLEVLPYTFTTSQQLVVSEIIEDLKRPVPMNRLLQVGLLLVLLYCVNSIQYFPNFKLIPASCTSYL